MLELTPRQIVEELDKYIVGQREAKRAIAVAIRNRWRRQRIAEEMRDEIGPKNMMMIGPTGVGKTEIARRLAAMTGAPFVKVDATKYTEVGYYGRDVESMARELVENAVGIVRAEERELVAEKAKEAAEKRIVDALVEKFERENRDAERKAAEEAGSSKENAKDGEQTTSASTSPSDPFAAAMEAASRDPKFRAAMDAVRDLKFDPTNPTASFEAMAKAVDEAVKNAPSNVENATAAEPQNASQTAVKAEVAKLDAAPKRVVDRDEIERRLRLGEYENETIPVVEERRSSPVVMGGVGLENMQDEIQSMLESLTPRRRSRREIPVSEARAAFVEQESERALDKEKIDARAVELAENLGIIFIDEIDKIVGSEGGRGADVSRQGVQRDLLPIVEGTTVQTKHGMFSTEHVLFIAAGAFHRVKPSDLTPELQGRFPIRVELSELKKEDFVRILTEPKSALTKQYVALLKTENVDLVFEPDAIEALAEYAATTNATTQNIGARRLYAMMELLLEDLSFEAPEMGLGRVVVNAAYVREKIDRVAKDEDLSKFVL
ncbi:MAG: ATP-dependent protease ATP-binding subunit HslU [Thermoguttaceae bacterium]|nr:ATP-dependent protease ATP-binding subunit HslU [Thermoguttaceae bacterium]